jgi:hypothetical protein
VTKERGLSQPKAKDLRNVFNTSFLDGALIPSVFKTEAELEQAKALWNAVAPDRIKKASSP